MPKILVIYYSRTGNVECMAQAVADGVRAEGVEVETKSVEAAEVEELQTAAGIIIGSPTYYGSMAAEIKSFLDKSIRLHGQLEGKVGAAFSSAANVGGGNETTILSILEAFLVHGMIVQGDSQGDHYGPVAIGAPDERAKSYCYRLGRRTAALTKNLSRSEEVDL